MRLRAAIDMAKTGDRIFRIKHPGNYLVKGVPTTILLSTEDIEAEDWTVCRIVKTTSVKVEWFKSGGIVYPSCDRRDGDGRFDWNELVGKVGTLTFKEE